MNMLKRVPAVAVTAAILFFVSISAAQMIDNTQAPNTAKAGINITPKIESQSVYYGKFTYGNSDWLDGTMSLVDYGDRGAPNVYLTAPLASGVAGGASPCSECSVV